MDVRLIDPEAANINKIQRHQGQHAREAAGGPALLELEHLVEIQWIGELLRDAVAPVIEIARYDERGRGGDQPLDAPPQLFDLYAPVAPPQAQVHAHAMQHLGPARRMQLAMQEAAALVAMSGK